MAGLFPTATHILVPTTNLPDEVHDEDFHYSRLMDYQFLFTIQTLNFSYFLIWNLNDLERMNAQYLTSKGFTRYITQCIAKAKPSMSLTMTNLESKQAYIWGLWSNTYPEYFERYIIQKTDQQGGQAQSELYYKTSLNYVQKKE